MLTSMDVNLSDRRRQDRAAVLVWLLAMALIAGLALVAHRESRSLARDLRAVATVSAPAGAAADAGLPVVVEGRRASSQELERGRPVQTAALGAPLVAARR